MKALIFYDSVFGNTEQIAKAMYLSLLSKVDVEITQIKNLTINSINKINYLIVGSPTRGFSPTKDIKDFLDHLPANILKGIKVATFDTRLSPGHLSRTTRFIVKTGGYAATPIAKRLISKGGELSVPPEGFFVTGEEGPLLEGEIERAERWILQILD